jgi:hypothetical protein
MCQIARTDRRALEKVELGPLNAKTYLGKEANEWENAAQERGMARRLGRSVSVCAVELGNRSACGFSDASQTGSSVTGTAKAGTPGERSDPSHR